MPLIDPSLTPASVASPTDSGPNAAVIVASLRDRLTEAALHRFDVGVAVGMLVEALQALGMDARRVSLAVLSLHPSLAGVGFVWSSEGGDVTRTDRPWGFLETPEHKASALQEVMTSRRTLRLRLAEGEGIERFPVLRDFLLQGATEYLAFPLSSAREDVHVCTMWTDRAGGWSDEEVRLVETVMPTLALLIEVFEAHRLTSRERMDLLLLAHTDPMTRLLNRHGIFLEAENRFGEGRPCIAVYLDLDGIKSVNDRMGHHFGDRVIKGAADRITACLPPGAIAGRMGGDEFLVYADAACEDLPDTLCAALGEVYVVNESRFSVTASVGSAAYAPVAMAELSRRADLAMLESKRGGKNRVVRYQEDTDVRHARGEQIGRLLPGALARDEIHIVIQPILCLATGVVTHGECLARWVSPELGEVSPNEFVPVAEQSDVIKLLDRFVLQEALKLLVRMRDECAEPVPLAINVSARDASLASLGADVVRGLREHDVHPSQLIIELTESVFIDRFNEAVVRLNQLREHGVAIALDDFGTGYSSLSYLQRLYFDYVKIDRSLVAALPSQRTHAIIESVVGLGRSLEARVVAEGVETQEQLDSLVALGCEFAQGFLYSRPLSIQAWVELVRSGQRLRVPVASSEAKAPVGVAARISGTWSLPPKRGKKVAVLGGGVAGMAIAARLLRSGWDVRLYERSEPVERGGKGFLLLANGVEAAQRLGIWDTMAELGHPLDTLELRDPSGGVIRSEPLEATGFDHGKFASYLLRGMPVGAVSWGKSVTTVVRDARGMVTSARMEDGSTIEADVFIAADGNRSVVRNAIYPDLKLGLDRVHELVCAIEAPDLVRSLKGRFLKFVDVKRALAVGIVPCNARSVVWFVQVDASAVRFDGLDSSARSALVRELVGDWSLPVLDLILRTNFGRSYVWRTADMDPLPALAAGNLAFVGDSGHPLLPFTSQGVASALMDAVALGDMMDLFPNDIPSAFQCYSDERLPEVTALQRAGQKLRRSFLDRGASGEDAATPFVVPPIRKIP